MKLINKHNFIKLSAAICGLLLLTLSGCSEKAQTDSFIQTAETPMALGVKSSKKMRVADSVALNSFDSFEMAEECAVDNGSPNFERKLIKTGNLTLEIPSLSDAEDMISAFAKAFGGYITDSSTYEYSYNSTVKIPSDRFEEAMAAAGELGKVKYRSVNSQDVTEEFYDLTTRLETKRIMQKKLESYLSSAKDIKDLLEIERQLNNVTSEIEVMEGRIRRLSNQIDFSTIYICINLPTGHNESGFQWPDLGEDFREFAQNTVSFFASLFMSLFYIVVYGIPLLALIALFYWLLFGRIGLLVKLFRLLKSKKNKEN